MSEKLNYLDSHCHPYFEQFKHARPDPLTLMKEHKVGGVIVGTGRDSSKQAIAFSKQWDKLWASVGQHPTVLDEFDLNFFKQLMDNKEENKIVAIGECGLDYFRMLQEDKTRQKKLFESQIQLAIEYDVPLILHIRSSANSTDAHDDAFDILSSYKKQYPTLHLHMHFFTANIDVARNFLKLDATFGIPGVVTFARSVRETVEYLPLDKILAETDAPYAAPVPHRGELNYPHYVKHVVEKIAQIKGLSLEETRDAILQNTWGVFKL